MCVGDRLDDRQPETAAVRRRLLPAAEPFECTGEEVGREAGPTFHYADVRFFATGGLYTITQSWCKISMNPAHGDGGTCYGDSGGPNFLGAGSTETNIVAGTTVTGDFLCKATNVDYRLDTESARSFLSQFVALP